MRRSFGIQFAGILVFHILVSSPCAWAASDSKRESQTALDLAPPSFAIGSDKVVFVDVSSVKSTWTVDVDRHVVAVNARTCFFQREQGWPVIMLDAPIHALSVNGVDMATDRFQRVTSPDKVTQLWALKVMLPPGNTCLDFAYDISDRATFSPSGIELLTIMNDIGPAAPDIKMLEHYLPANLEFDQFPVDLSICFTDQGQVDRHRIVVNGDVETVDHCSHVHFPDFYTSSAQFLHVFPIGTYSEIKGSLKLIGKDRSIPLLVYGKSATELAFAEVEIQRAADEFSRSFGPFIHQQFIAFIWDHFGGQEFGGAMMTSTDHIRHEVAHSWFGRDVMPANGDSGWIDEAIAGGWLAGFPSRPRALSLREPTRFDVGSRYSRVTFPVPEVYYHESGLLAADLDYLLGPAGGLEAALANFHREFSGKVYTEAMFWSSLERFSHQDLTAFRRRYVQGINDLPIRDSTALSWQTIGDGFLFRSADDRQAFYLGHTTVAVFTQSAAERFCTSIDQIAEGLPQGLWRVPTLTELIQLHASGIQFAIGGQIDLSEPVWTSSRYADLPQAWAVNLRRGEMTLWHERTAFSGVTCIVNLR